MTDLEETYHAPLTAKYGLSVPRFPPDAWSPPDNDAPNVKLIPEVADLVDRWTIAINMRLHNVRGNIVSTSFKGQNTITIRMLQATGGIKWINGYTFMWTMAELHAAPVQLSEIELTLGHIWTSHGDDKVGPETTEEEPSKTWEFEPTPHMLWSIFKIRNTIYTCPVPYADLVDCPKRTFFFRKNIHPKDMQYLRAILHVSKSHILTIMIHPMHTDKHLRVLWIDADTVEPDVVQYVDAPDQVSLAGWERVSPDDNAKHLYYNLKDTNVRMLVATTGGKFTEHFKESAVFDPEYHFFKQRRFWVRWHHDYPNGDVRVDLRILQPSHCIGQMVALNRHNCHGNTDSVIRVEDILQPYGQMPMAALQSNLVILNGAVYASREEANQVLLEKVMASQRSCTR